MSIIIVNYSLIVLIAICKSIIQNDILRSYFSIFLL
jgi:hypothetical protein